MRSIEIMSTSEVMNQPAFQTDNHPLNLVDHPQFSVEMYIAIYNVRNRSKGAEAISIRGRQIINAIRFSNHLEVAAFLLGTTGNLQEIQHLQEMLRLQETISSLREAYHRQRVRSLHEA